MILALCTPHGSAPSKKQKDFKYDQAALRFPARYLIDRALLERLQIFDQIVLFLRHESRLEEAVVVLDDIAERGKPAVVIEAAFGMREQSLERRCAIAIVG